MIDKEMILANTQNGLTIFKHYIPFDFKLGHNFKNPFYKDTRASCNIYYDRHNQAFKIKDFGNDDFSGDCFAFVAQIHHLDVRKDFSQVLRLINQDLSLHLEEKPKDLTHLKSKKSFVRNKSINDDLKPNPPAPLPLYENSKPYHFTEKAFSLRELKFWKAYGISEKTLLYFQVKSVEDFQSINKEGATYQLQSSQNKPIFGYSGETFIKLYRPNSSLRFLYGGLLPETYCFGLKQLPNRGDILFITGGEKDVMSLYAKGFYAICFNSETSLIPTHIIAMLTRRFKHIVLLYDVDKAGISASEQHLQHLSKYSLQRLLLPLSGTKKEKDISDFFAKGNNRKDFQKMVFNLLKSIYNQTMVLLKSCEVDFENPPELTENIISVNNVPLGTQGNILCITGGEGTGKSNYASAIVAGTLAKQDSQIDTLGLDIQANFQSKAVLLYDTEQSENQLYKNTALLLKRAGINEKPDWFKAFFLTAMSRKERLQSIQDSMDYYYHLYGGIHLIVIDGIADLVRSANDEIESIAIVEELYRLAGIYKTCILCVLHFVPNSFKLRGHLGSELQRKSAGILSIEKDTVNPNISVVKTLKVREGSPLDIPLMQFAWDKQKAMHIYKGERPHNEKEKRKEMELTNIAKDIFSQNRQLGYQDLVDEIEVLMDVKDRTAKNYIRYMRDKKIIQKNPANTSYYLIKPNL